MLAQSFGPTDVVAIGDTLLVMVRKYGGTPSSSRCGARVRGSDGVVLDLSPVVLGGGCVSRPPVLVELGGRWLVAWHSNCSHDNPNADTAGGFMKTNCALTSSFWLHGPFSTDGGNGIFGIGLASNGVTALLAQSQELNSGVETHLLAASTK